jgi:hypothetical protein
VGTFRRPRYQVTLQLLPGAEPWLLVRTSKGHFKLPAQCSLLELWEQLSGGRTGANPPTGEVMVRVPLSLALKTPTLAAYRQSGRRSSSTT